MEPNFFTTDEIVESEDIAVPHRKIQLPKPFNECEQKLLLKCGVFTTASASYGVKGGATIFQLLMGLLEVMAAAEAKVETEAKAKVVATC